MNYATQLEPLNNSYTVCKRKRNIFFYTMIKLGGLKKYRVYGLIDLHKIHNTIQLKNRRAIHCKYYQTYTI